MRYTNEQLKEDFNKWAMQKADYQEVDDIIIEKIVKDVKEKPQIQPIFLDICPRCLKPNFPGHKCQPVLWEILNGR